MLDRRYSVLLACIFGITGAYAQTGTPPATTSAPPAASPAPAERMDKNAAKAERDRIEAAYKADKDACKALKDNAKDVCMEEAKAKEKLALAELKFKETGSPRDKAKIAETKAKTDYAVAKERCEDKPLGAERSTCKKEAKNTEKSALAEAKKTGV